MLFGYVDPGIIGALSQMLYAVVFGVIAAVIFKPWVFLKSKFYGLRGRARTAAPKRPVGTGLPEREAVHDDHGHR